MLLGMIPVIAGASYGPAPGQQSWTGTTSTTFVVPAGVTSISAVCVGHGGTGTNMGGGTHQGGRGGDLRYAVTLAVTPGESLTITIPELTTNAATQILRSGTPLLQAACGSFNTSVGGTSSTIGGNIGGGNGGSGQSSSSADYGGGGAGGYSGNGGAGNFNSAGGNGSGGGGGGGARGGGGGGVGILGEGSNGTGGANSTGQPGTGGSGGANGTSNSGFTGGNGGAYGGGGGYLGGGSAGTRGAGAIRIIWGAGRAYPSTGTADA